MAKSKLMSAIAELSEQETGTIRKILKQKFAHKRPDILNLFELLISSNQDKSKEIIWKKLYGSKIKFNDLKWRTLNMKLNAEVVYVMKNSYLDNFEPGLSGLISIKTFFHKKLQKHLNASWTELEKIIDSPRHSDHFYYLSKAHEIRQVRIFQKKGRNLKFEDLKKSEEYNEIHYRCQKLKNACYSIANQMAQNIDIGLSDQFIQRTIEDYGEPNPLLNLYGSIIFLFREKNEFDLTFCQDLFTTHVDRIHKEESFNILTHLMNYCIESKINKGKLEYFHNLFFLYQLGIQKEILFNNNSLDSMHYKNIITVGLNTKNYEWTKSFIEQYTSRIPINEQENAYNFNMANVLFQQEAYDEVLDLLNAVEYNNIQYMLGTKLIQAKTYYEIGETQALEALIESFRVLIIRTTKISKDLKTKYTKFLRVLRKLAYLNPYDKEEINKLREQVKNDRGVVGRTWIMEKLDQHSEKA